MAWSGGTFTRTNGVNSGATTWATDAAAGVLIVDTRHDTHDQDLATGINQCINKDGSNTASQINCDNLRLDGNTVSSTNSNGDINFTPNGTGAVKINGEPITAAASRLELGNQFTAGGEVAIVKHGNVVTITAEGALAHASLSTVTSSAGIIPAAYRPSAQTGAVYYVEGTVSYGGAGILCRVSITSSGALSTHYVDFAGTVVARTDTYVAFTISYSLEDNIS